MITKIFSIKDIIALLLVATFCISIFLPEKFVSDDTMGQFERILGVVIGFYFGAHVAGKVNTGKPKKET